MIRRKKHTEKELVNGCAKNQRRYQEALYRLYFDSMMRMCFRYTSDMETAMTICNDGFLKVFKRIDSFAFKGSLEGWIRKIVYHALADHFRRESKYIQFMVFDTPEKSTDPTAMHELYFDDVVRLIEKLPNMSGTVFRMYAIEGFNHREIGNHLGISENTSKWHLSNARKKLKEMLKIQNQPYVRKQR